MYTCTRVPGYPGTQGTRVGIPRTPGAVEERQSSCAPISGSPHSQISHSLMQPDIDHNLASCN
eukprot:3146372-Rhodomonas_salina.1